MKNRIIAMLIVAFGTSWASAAEGQSLREVFKRVNSSVVVVRSMAAALQQA